MMNFEMKYTGVEKVNTVLNGLIESFEAAKHHTLLSKVGQLYIDETKARFDKQYDVDRKKWKPLSKTTIRLKGTGDGQRGPGIKGPTHRGIWTGDLQKSIKMRFEGDTVYIGSDVEYAPWFNYGVKQKNGHPWGPIPSRRFLGRNKRIDDKVVKLMKAELLKETGLNIDSIKSAV